MILMNNLIASTSVKVDTLTHREELSMTDFDALITEMTDRLLTLIVENDKFQCFNHEINSRAQYRLVVAHIHVLHA